MNGSADPEAWVARLAEAVVTSEGRIAIDEVDIIPPESVDALANCLAGLRFDLVFINAGISGPEHQSVDVMTPAERARLSVGAV